MELEPGTFVFFLAFIWLSMLFWFLLFWIGGKWRQQVPERLWTKYIPFIHFCLIMFKYCCLKTSQWVLKITKSSMIEISVCLQTSQFWGRDVSVSDFFSSVWGTEIWGLLSTLCQHPPFFLLFTALSPVGYELVNKDAHLYASCILLFRKQRIYRCIWIFDMSSVYCLFHAEELSNPNKPFSLVEICRIIVRQWLVLFILAFA